MECRCMCLLASHRLSACFLALPRVFSVPVPWVSSQVVRVRTTNRIKVAWTSSQVRLFSVSFLCCRSCATAAVRDPVLFMLRSYDVNCTAPSAWPSLACMVRFVGVVGAMWRAARRAERLDEVARSRNESPLNLEFWFRRQFGAVTCHWSV